MRKRLKTKIYSRYPYDYLIFIYSNGFSESWDSSRRIYRQTVWSTRKSQKKSVKEMIKYGLWTDLPKAELIGEV